MSASSDNQDISNEQNSPITDDGQANAGSKEDKLEVETQVIDAKNAHRPQKASGQERADAAATGSGGGRRGGAGGTKPAEPDSAELFTNWSEFLQFLQDCVVEYKKISWPTRQQVLQETWSVIVLVAVLTCLVLAFDWAVAKTVFEPLDKFAKNMGGGVGRTMQSWTPPPIPQSAAPASPPASPASSSTPAGESNKTAAPAAPAGSHSSETDPGPSSSLPSPAGQPAGNATQSTPSGLPEGNSVPNTPSGQSGGSK